MTETIYPLSALRALALHSQGLDIAVGTEPEPVLQVLEETIRQIGCIQIDTLQMVMRSQYLVLWSRLGKYNPDDLDRLVYDPGNRRLFEYWKHAASIVPLEEYRYHLPMMQYFEEGNHHWNSEWLDQPGSKDLVVRVYQRIEQEGALRAADFKSDDGPRGAWWDWKPAKHALEYLFNTGKVMISNRVNFQRVYDLKERVLPKWVDTLSVTNQQRDRFRICQAIRCLGVAEPGHTADYAWTQRTGFLPILGELIDEGIIELIKGEVQDGSVKELIIHREDLTLLEQAAEGAIPAMRTTFLSPFDSLFWARGRDLSFWNFNQVLEAYKRPADRQWGYFCLPILHKDRLVGRFDPKLERKTKTIHLRALYLEPGVGPEPEMVAAIAHSMRDFLKFHTATNLVIEKSQPDEFGRLLLNKL